MPNLHVFTCLSVGGTEVETGLPLGHKVDSRKPLLGVRDNPCSDGGSSELALLQATPPVWMGQHELDFVRYRVPAALSIGVGGNKERFCRVKKITNEIGEDVNDGLSLREGCCHQILQCCRRLRRSNDKLPPADGEYMWMKDTLCLRTTASEGDFHHPGALFRSQHLGSYRFDHNTRSKEPSLTQRLGCLGTCHQFTIVVR
jgi:hypothetical protein